LEEFEETSVYYAATPMEAQLCINDPVVVVGGDNSAGQATIFLADHVEQIRLVVREHRLDEYMSRYLADQIERDPGVFAVYGRPPGPRIPLLLRVILADRSLHPDCSFRALAPGSGSDRDAVLPPVPDATMKTRWQRFAKVFADTTMARHQVPADPARTLVLFGSPNAGWSAFTADRRSEWTYAEALAAAITKATTMPTVPSIGANT
jgi:hypothetical protein